MARTAAQLEQDIARLSVLVDATDGDPSLADDNRRYRELLERAQRDLASQEQLEAEVQRPPSRAEETITPQELSEVGQLMGVSGSPDLPPLRRVIYSDAEGNARARVGRLVVDESDYVRFEEVTEGGTT